MKLQKGENTLPYYSAEDNCWKVCIDGKEIEGDLYECVSNLIHYDFIFCFGDGSHGHSFEDVLNKITPFLHLCV